MFQPAAFTMRSATASPGVFLPRSYAESVGCEVPERAASSAWPIPLAKRASSITVLG